MEQVVERTRVKIGPKGQVVVGAKLRRLLSLEPGQAVEVRLVERDGHRLIEVESAIMADAISRSTQKQAAMKALEEWEAKWGPTEGEVDAMLGVRSDDY